MCKAAGNVYCTCVRLHAGAQLREWLLYFSLQVLHGILPSSLFNHYYYLVAGVHIVLADAISPAQITCADDCFREFYSHFSTIYGMHSFLYCLSLLLALLA